MAKGTYYPKHRKMRLSTKLGLIGHMWKIGHIDASYAIRAIFS